MGKGGGGGVYPDPEIKGEPGLPKHFAALRASVSSKSKGKARPPPHPLDPPLAYTERLCRKEYESAGISPVEVYERVGISVISVCKEAQKGQQVHFVAVKKSKKRSGVVVNSYFKDSASTKSVTRYVKEVKHALVNRRYTLSKMVNKW